ncbi:MAG: ComEC/Rec2 family competence protein [Candidatus Saccharimonadales bacterium]
MKHVKAYGNSVIVSIFCTGILAGIALTKLQVLIELSWLLILLPLLVFVIRRHNIYILGILLLFGLIIGNFRGNSFSSELAFYDEFNNKKVEMLVTPLNDAQYNDRKQLEFDAKILRVGNGESEAPAGKIKVSGFGESAIYKGDQLVVSGKLFKTRGSRQASVGFAQIRLVSRGDFVIDNIRRQFASGISSVLPDPQAPFGLGLLIGQKSTLSEEATSWLAAVGLTHIIAVSGYNLTIIVRFITRVFGKRSRYQTVLFSIVTIGLFLLMTGFSASIVRASIVCGLSLFAWYYGRKIKPMVLILLTASITAVWYPSYLWSDIGWYLSFLAFFGVLVLAPLITKRVFRSTPRPLTSALIETICAQIMTVPLILYIFGEFSTVTLISNMLVVCLIPLAMLLTLVAGIVGMINPATLYLLAVPAKILLSYILFVAYRLSLLPNALITQSISVLTMTVLYAIIALLCVLLWNKTKGGRGIITDVI